MKVQPIDSYSSANTFGIKAHCRRWQTRPEHFHKSAAIGSQKHVQSQVPDEQIITELTNYNKTNNLKGYDFLDPYDKVFIPFIVRAKNELGQEAALSLARFVKRTKDFDSNYYKEVIAEQFIAHPDTLNRWKYQDNFSPKKIGELSRILADNPDEVSKYEQLDEGFPDTIYFIGKKNPKLAKEMLTQGSCYNYVMNKTPKDNAYNYRLAKAIGEHPESGKYICEYFQNNFQSDSIHSILGVAYDDCLNRLSFTDNAAQFVEDHAKDPKKVENVLAKYKTCSIKELSLLIRMHDKYGDIVSAALINTAKLAAQRPTTKDHVHRYWDIIDKVLNNLVNGYYQYLLPEFVQDFAFGLI